MNDYFDWKFIPQNIANGMSKYHWCYELESWCCSRILVFCDDIQIECGLNLLSHLWCWCRAQSIANASMGMHGWGWGYFPCVWNESFCFEILWILWIVGPFVDCCVLRTVSGDGLWIVVCVCCVFVCVCAYCDHVLRCGSVRSRNLA